MIFTHAYAILDRQGLFASTEQKLIIQIFACSPLIQHSRLTSCQMRVLLQNQIFKYIGSSAWICLFAF